MAILVWRIAVLIISVTHVNKAAYYGGATKSLLHINEIKNIGAFGDAENRGPRWYDDATDSKNSATDMKSEVTDEDSSLSLSQTISETSSSDASSVETSERRRMNRVYRTCTPCPREMMKKHKNIGIKWICGGYQRARRTFKSECMMRYRNCQDGTMFLKLHDHHCKNDTYHGRHWFYVYKV